jgi:hypothetical protein
LSREEVLAVVLAHQTAIGFCYERQLQSFPHLSGEVLLGWTVNLNGRTESVEIVCSTLGNSEAASCMARQVARWEFSKPRSISKIQFPLFFKGR